MFVILEPPELLLDEKPTRIAALEEQLKRSQALAKSLLTGISHYEANLENALSSYRNQRAWRLMIAVRKAYDLWARHGLTGKLRAVPLLLAAPFKGGHSYPEQEIQLPAIRNYIPAGVETGDLREGLGNSLPAPLPRKYDVVILAIVDFDYRFQRPQQIAAQFAKNGHRVFWISPTRFVPPNNPSAYFLHPIRGNIWEVYLRGPQPRIYLGALQPESTAAFEESLRGLYRDLAISENLLLVQLPFWRRLALALRHEQGGVLTYDCMDDWDAFENLSEFNRQEELLLAQECDLLLVTAEGLRRKFIDRGLSPVLIRNGVDCDFFAGAPCQTNLSGVPKPIIGYFGAIADWIDLDLISAVAALRPQYSFVLIGQVFGRDITPLQELPNVFLLGNQPYESIPGYLREFDACMIPFLLNDVTAATDPVKLYEYLSLGKPVVATGMAEILEHGDLIYIAKGVEDFSQKLDRCLAESGDDLKNRRIEFAKRNTWADRVEAIQSAVQSKFPLVSIVIVTHNSQRFVGPCLESIVRNASYPNCEIIVVDNGSTDKTPGILRRYAARHSEVQCEFLEENKGFAAANNIGSKLAKGEFLILLNADTMVTPGWVGRMLAPLEQDATIGLLCPTTNFAGNEAKISTAYTDETSMEEFSALLSTEARHRNSGLSMAPLFCGVIRRSLYEQLGGLDEGYGVGMFEDDDLSAAVIARGLRIVVAEDCFVHHFGQGSFAQLAPQEYAALFERNRGRFERKWHTSWQAHRLRRGVIPPDEDLRFEPENFCKTVVEA
jgi:GT2 family glycosyltransferase/glycosyltransferase involved in cell wall biosynthesis